MQAVIAPATNQFSALNPNLPRLAAKAALDMDLVLSVGNSANADLPESVTYLLSKLKSMEGSSLWKEPPGSNSYLLDPLNGDVFSHSLAAAKLKSLSQLDASTKKVIDGGDGDRQSLFEALRDFFVALSEFASHKRDAIFSTGQGVLPYRIG